MPFMYSFTNFIGIYLLLAANGLLFLRILLTRSCTGISQKTQILYALVLTSRVIYFFWDLGSRYEYYLYLSSAFIILLIVYGINMFVYNHYKTSCDEKEYDDFNMWNLLAPCTLLALLIGREKIFLSFSLYLETVAMVPQIYFVRNAKSIKKVTFIYVSLVTAYRFFSIIDTIDFTYGSDSDGLNVHSALIQLMICCNFLTRILREKKDEIFGAGDSSNLLDSNLKDVVLSPSMLNEKNQKDIGLILPTVHENNKVNFDTTPPTY